MKKIVLALIVCLMTTLLFACNDNKPNNNGGNNENVVNNANDDGSAQGNKKNNDVPFSIEEYEDTDFTDRAGFKVTKSDDLSDVSYDTILLHGSESAQLDLKFANGKIGTLKVGKTVISVETDEDVSTYKIDAYEVSTYVSLDGIRHYLWQKDGFYYKLSTLEDFSNQELTNIIGGYSVEVGE